MAIAPSATATLLDAAIEFLAADNDEALESPDDQDYAAAIERKANAAQALQAAIAEEQGK